MRVPTPQPKIFTLASPPKLSVLVSWFSSLKGGRKEPEEGNVASLRGARDETTSKRARQ